MTMKSLLFLIGYRGTGKTTLGRPLAERLGWDFVDADVFLEAKYRKTIRVMFADEGEAAFRDKESTVLRELCNAERCVIATGGGIILREENRRLLRESGLVVWLMADVPTIAERMEADPTSAERRPNLTIGGTVEIEDALRIREPLYRQCADLEIATTGRSPEALIEAILTRWNSSNISPGTLSG
jgi:shikimate kinase